MCKHADALCRIREGKWPPIMTIGHVFYQVMDPDPDSDPIIFVIDLQDANKKQICLKSFLAYYLLKAHLHHY
jgi:hypothetical protein